MKKLTLIALLLMTNLYSQANQCVLGSVAVAVQLDAFGRIASDHHDNHIEDKAVAKAACPKGTKIVVPSAYQPGNTSRYGQMNYACYGACSELKNY